MLSVYSMDPADWATLGESYPFYRDAIGIFFSSSQLGYIGGVLTFLQRCSRCILQPHPTGHRTLVRGVLPLYAEMQSVYSTAPVNWAIIIVGRIKRARHLKIFTLQNRLHLFYSFFFVFFSSFYIFVFVFCFYFYSFIFCFFLFVLFSFLFYFCFFFLFYFFCFFFNFFVFLFFLFCFFSFFSGE